MDITVSPVIGPIIFLTIAGAASLFILYQYWTTKIKDYLIFSIAFISFFVDQLIVILTEIDLATPYNSQVSHLVFVWAVRIQFWTTVVGWSSFVVIALRMKWHRINAIFWLYTVWGSLLIIASLFMDIESLPDTGYFLGIIVPTSYTGREILLFSIDGFLTIGQGYFTFLYLFRLSISLLFLYVNLTMKDTYGYPTYKWGKYLWISSMLTYSIAQVLNIASELIGITSDVLLQVLLGWAAMSLLIIVSFIPEAIILSKVQIVRVLKLYKDKEIENILGERFLTHNIYDYLKFIEDRLEEVTQDNF